MQANVQITVNNRSTVDVVIRYVAPPRFVASSVGPQGNREIASPQVEKSATVLPGQTVTVTAVSNGASHISMSSSGILYSYEVAVGVNNATVDCASCEDVSATNATLSLYKKMG